MSLLNLLSGAGLGSLLEGGSPASAGFVRRMMAENALKHKGQYKNPSDPLHPNSTMSAPRPFEYKKLKNKSAFIQRHFGNVGAVPFERKRGATPKYMMEGKPFKNKRRIQFSSQEAEMEAPQNETIYQPMDEPPAPEQTLAPELTNAIQLLAESEASREKNKKRKGALLDIAKKIKSGSKISNFLSGKVKVSKAKKVLADLEHKRDYLDKGRSKEQIMEDAITFAKDKIKEWKTSYENPMYDYYRQKEPYKKGDDVMGWQMGRKHEVKYLFNNWLMSQLAKEFGPKLRDEILKKRNLRRETIDSLAQTEKQQSNWNIEPPYRAFNIGHNDIGYEKQPEELLYKLERNLDPYRLLDEELDNYDLEIGPLPKNTITEKKPPPTLRISEVEEEAPKNEIVEEKPKAKPSGKEEDTKGELEIPLRWRRHFTEPKMIKGPKITDKHINFRLDTKGMKALLYDLLDRPEEIGKKHTPVKYGKINSEILASVKKLLKEKGLYS